MVRQRSSRTASIDGWKEQRPRKQAIKGTAKRINGAVVTWRDQLATEQNHYYFVLAIFEEGRRSLSRRLEQVGSGIHLPLVLL
jgi:hypothetical protein